MKRLLAAVCLTTLVGAAGPASAQLRADAAIEGVARSRFLGARPEGGSNAGPGAGLEVTGHVALVPLVRLGVYAGAEVSPQGDAAARRIYTYGLSARLASPWPNGDLHAWLFTGLGYASVVAPGYEATQKTSAATAGSAVRVAPAGGGFLEVPLGIGVGYKLWRPVEILAEVGGSLAFGASGSLYAARPFTDSLQQTGLLPSAGVDRGAVFLRIGAGIDF